MVFEKIDKLKKERTTENKELIAKYMYFKKESMNVIHWTPKENKKSKF